MFYPSQHQHLFFNFRFVADQDNYETIEKNPDNGCFCNNVSEWCGKYSGLYNISECQYGAPILMSWPHFFQACINVQ